MADKKERAEKRGIVWSERKRWWCGLPWTFTTYSFSPDRIFVRHGVLTLREDEVRLYRVKDISLSRTLIQRIFGLGSVRICSTDSTLKDFELKNVRHAEDVKEQLSDLVEAERERKRVSMREFLGHEGEHDYEDFDVVDTLDV